MPRHNRRPLARCLLMLLGSGALFWACVTSGDGGDGEDRVRTHYTLRVGETARFSQPLPARSSILVDWHYSDSSVESVEGFRGWDFDHDGRFEMVEMLGDDGKVQARVYDFDGDGRADRIENLP